MDTPRYFQWQNESLVKTIYPLREMKLRDFLFFYQEIDLWKEYKDKTIDDLKDDIRAHYEAQARTIKEAVENYTQLREYFLLEDVSSVYQKKFGQVDNEEIKKINLIHAAFAKYFPKLTDPRRERYFIAAQVTQLEPHRKEITQRITQRIRRLNAISPAHPTRPVVEAEIDKLKTITLPMGEFEFDRLRAFLASQTKLESRRIEISQARTAALNEQKTLTRNLDPLQQRLSLLKAQRQDASEDLNRLKNPPEAASLETYFFNDNVTALLRKRYPDASPDLIKTINDLHHEIKTSFQHTQASPARQRALKIHIYNLQQELKKIEKNVTQLETSLRNMGPTWKRHTEVTAQVQSLRKTNRAALAEEIDRLNAYWAALNASQLTPAEQSRLIQEKENSLSKIEQSWQQLTTEITTLQSRIQRIEKDLLVTDEEKLLRATPVQPLTVKDIVRGKLEAYKGDLDQKDHFALLEEIIQRFTREPDRFPLWLQYMVIHFSGMRYQSAHGSWADPRDLLANLRSSTLEKDINKLDDASKDAIIEQKLIAYGIGDRSASTGDAPPSSPPPLLQATAPQWKEKLARHLRALQNPSAFHRRKALFDLLSDEENFEVESLSNDQVREALEEMQASLPAWMWKEIVKLTDLRVQFVEDANWEELDAKEQAEKSEYRWQEYRLMMSKWKENSTTAWRDEHDQNNQLIVTRAVCNETAEHIQHIRGNSPLGGLTAKPKWYLGLETAAAGKPAPPGDKNPHFIIPRNAEDFSIGASVLWLRFVNEMPNPWRIAPPLTLKSGEGLLPAQFFSGGQQEGGWVYQQAGNVISRRRNVLDANKRKTGEEKEYLRWIHEATVAEVAETADGPVVLTFETALPNEDKRLSSIGVFKHYLQNIVYEIKGGRFNASFVGYTPEGDIPSEDLEFMLDWNKILLREVMLEAELLAYKKKYFYRKYRALKGYGK